MSVKKSLESAKQVLMGEIARYADIVASQRPTSTPSKVARRQLAEIHAAVQAIEASERAIDEGRWVPEAFGRQKHSNEQK